jgi:glycosyltransferase involved in cell wall biosynthesis
VQNSTIPGKNGIKKPRVALIHYSGPPIIAGVELIMKDQARLFRFFNYKADIIVGAGKQFRKDIPVHVIKRMDSTNRFILQVRSELAKNKVSSTFYQMEKSLYTHLKKYILNNGISVCIVHNVMTRHYNLPLTAALTRLSNDMPGVKFIAWVHDTTFSDTSYLHIDPKLSSHFPWNLLVTPMDNWQYVCISEFRKRELLETFEGKKPKHITVIPNGLDVEKFLELSPQMRLFYQEVNGLHSDLIACIPVRVVRRKNLELGIMITAAMIKKGVNFKLIITGNPDHHQADNLAYYNELKQLVSKLGLENNVFFLAEFLKKLDPSLIKEQIKVSEVYQISDLLLMTSTIEGFGLPLIEAGLTRVPIFASDIKPFHEIGTTNINYFSVTTSPERIADIILNRIEKMPQAYFYRKVIKKYSLKDIFKNKIIPLINPNITK